MAELEQAAEDLFFKLRNRFPQIKMGDENGAPTVDPQHARFFNFIYTDKESKRPYGEITCSLISGDALKVFFDTAITERMLPEDKDYWYLFLRELRRMAKGHMLNFDVRDITKDTLSRADYQFMQTTNPEKKKMKESLEESKVYWNRRGKVSEGDLNNVRIHVVHNEKMLENPNNRLLKVDRIFLVNENGEKFLLPFKSVSGAKAMANHVSRGGNPYDTQGQLIGRAVNEMRNLGRFIRTTHNKTFEAAEAGNVIKSAIEMRESIKRHLGRLSNNSRNFNESLTELANLISEQTEDLGEVKGWFTQQTYNENLDNYLASAAGAYKKLKESTMGKIAEAAGAVEQKILDPNFKLVLKADPALDKLMVTRKYTDNTALLSAVLGDIANRLMSKDGDDVSNFASLMGDLISSEGEAFGQRPDPEYSRDKKLAIVLAQKYMKELGEVMKNPEAAKELRVEPSRRGAPVNTSSEADEFEESIMGIGEAGPADEPEHPDADADDKRWDDVEEGLLGDVGKHIAKNAAMGAAGTAALAGGAALGAVGGAAKGAYTGARDSEAGVGNRVVGALKGAAKGALSGAGSGIKKTWNKLNDDEEVEEGNEFSGALAAAKKAGKDSFEVDGKSYPVRESLNDMRRLAGLNEAPPLGGTVTKANAPAAAQKFQGTIKDFQKLNPGATVGQAMNAIQGKTAIKGGANDPAVIQAKNNANPLPGKSPTQAFDPAKPSSGPTLGAGPDSQMAAKPSDRPTQAAGTPQASLDAVAPKPAPTTSTQPVFKSDTVRPDGTVSTGAPSFPGTSPNSGKTYDAVSGTYKTPGTDNAPIPIKPEPAAPTTTATPATPTAPKADNSIPVDLMKPSSDSKSTFTPSGSTGPTPGKFTTDSIEALSKLAGIKG